MRPEMLRRSESCQTNVAGSDFKGNRSLEELGTAGEGFVWKGGWEGGRIDTSRDLSACP